MYTYLTTSEYVNAPHLKSQAHIFLDISFVFQKFTQTMANFLKDKL